jgi:hypothetical protein
MAKAPRVPGVTTTSEADTKAQPLPATPAPALPDSTPNAVDVDPTKLTAPLLTRQGWIVPPDKVKG